MNRRKNNVSVEPMDDIILLNDNYADKGLYTGYIGTVMDNHIEKSGYVVADFSNPITGDCIQPAVAINKDDFRVFSGNIEDRKIGKAFKDLFKK